MDQKLRYETLLKISTELIKIFYSEAKDGTALDEIGLKSVRTALKMECEVQSEIAIDKTCNQ